MFSFGFQVAADDLDDEIETSTSNLNDLKLDDRASQEEAWLPHTEVDLHHLMSTLPPMISYTPVQIPLTASNQASTSSLRLLRRDLFDARFQVISQDEVNENDENEDENSSSQFEISADKAGKGKGKQTFIDAASDLVKGVYEGGLKTWECSFDLIDCLVQRNWANPENSDETIRGKNVLELGCGTGLPSCAVFLRLLSEIRKRPTAPGEKPPLTRMHLQDYNEQVLSLMTLPNLLLTYALHLTTDESNPFQMTSSDSNDVSPGEVELNSEFLASFENLLEIENIEIKFFSGAWENFEAKTRFELILTSETIYSLTSLNSLLNVLQNASDSAAASNCLVACKRVYFGVGGGELEFKRRVAERGGTVTNVWHTDQFKGVDRTVMNIKWK